MTKLCVVKDPQCCTDAFEEHTCPYAEEIHDDHETKCRCCAACQRECAQDT